MGGTIGGILGGVVGSVVPGIGTALGSSIGGGLGSLAGGALGGSSGPVGAGGSQATNASGYGALPASVQQNISNTATAAGNLLLPGGSPNSSMFTPMPLTSQENQAMGLTQNTMSQQGIQSLVGNYLNPYIGAIEQANQQQFGGQNSLYQQQLAQSGQGPGSSRDMANTAYLQGQQQLALDTAIGGQYQNALNTGLTQNQLNYSNLMSQGGLQRQIGLQTAQAPLTALQSLSGLTAQIPGSSTGQTTTTPNQLANANILGQGGAQVGSTIGNSLFGSGGFFSSGGSNNITAPASYSPFTFGG